MLIRTFRTISGIVFAPEEKGVDITPRSAIRPHAERDHAVTTYIVTTTANETYNGGNLAAESTDGTGLSFNEAAGLAGDGDTITFDASLIGQSILHSTAIFTATGLTIDGDLDDDGISDITLDSDAGLRFQPGASATIDGMTITGVTHTIPVLVDNATLVVINSIFTGNTDGGDVVPQGIYSDNSSLTIQNSRFENSFGPSLVHVNGGTADITGSSFANNSATGLIVGTGANVTVSNTVFAHNTASNVTIFNGTATITDSILTGSTFRELQLDGTAVATFENSIIAGANTSISSSGSSYSLTFVGTNIVANGPGATYSGDAPTIEPTLTNIFDSISGNGGAVSLLTLPSGAQVYTTYVNPTGAAQSLGPAIPAVIGGNTTASMSENTGYTTGALTISDGNGAAEESFTAATLSGTYGNFTLTTEGNWGYSLTTSNSTVNGLNPSETLTETFTISSADGTTQDVVITITGADDPASVSGTVGGFVTEGDIGDAAVTATGDITIADPDTDDTPSFADVASTLGDNGYGSFVLSAGTWTYTLDQSTVQDLAAGDSVSDTHTYTASDGTTQVITVTITGTNDAANFGGTLTGAVDEDDSGTVTGTATVSDVDSSATFTADTVAGTYGSLSIDSSGNWSYDLDEANTQVQALTTGGTLSDTLTVQSADGTSQNITITITGVNDAASFGGTLAGSLGKNTASVGGNATVTDIDGSDSFTAATVAGAYGSLSIGTDGSWTYSLDTQNSTVSALKSSDTLSDSVAVTAADGTVQNITIIITGANNPPTTPDLSSSGVTENNAGAFIGTLSASDPEGSNVSFSTDDERFVINGNELWLRDGASLDYEAGSEVSVRVVAMDASGLTASAFVQFDVRNVAERSMVVGNAGHERLAGDSSADSNVMWARGGDDTVTGSAGGDRMGGGDGDDLLSGLGGNDTLYGGQGSDTLKGDAGNDVLYNGAGDDSVDGGSGDDRIWAGAGDDTLTGGAGEDTFIFGANTGNDVITDFDQAEDSLDLSARGFADFSALEAASSDVSVNGEDGLLILLGGGESVFIVGYSVTDLSGLNLVL